MNKPKPHATLFVVATPIGNLRDITLRALDTLHEVSVIFCEDTRVTRKLLNHYKITTPTKSYHAHSGPRGTATVISELENGHDCALVTDAGTPTISDPGSMLVHDIRAHFARSDYVVKISPIPGPDATSTALSIAGISTQPYFFYGFLPTKKGRQTLLQTLINQSTETTAVLYESPHRILKLLRELELYGWRQPVVITRELTKTFEEVLEDTPANLDKLLTDYPEKQKGEFVVLLPKQKSSHSPKICYTN